VPVPRGGLAYSPEQAAYRARELAGGLGRQGADPFRRARRGGRRQGLQVRGRGARATPPTCWADAGHQADRPNGKVVHRLWVEEATDIAQEIYLGFVLDRKSERIMIVASGHGGMEIEDLADEDPDSLVRMVIDPAPGCVEFQARELAFRLGLDGQADRPDGHDAPACYRAYRDLDAMMVEINPLVITGAGDLVALDAKMSFDTNALFRRPQVAALRDKSQEDPREASPPITGSPMSASTATSAASSTARASPWRRWT
jgi:malate-CoA ligase subunit beta